jgi:hypothetical protein
MAERVANPGAGESRPTQRESHGQRLGRPRADLDAPRSNLLALLESWRTIAEKSGWGFATEIAQRRSKNLWQGHS